MTKNSDIRDQPQMVWRGAAECRFLQRGQEHDDHFDFGHDHFYHLRHAGSGGDDAGESLAGA